MSAFSIGALLQPFSHLGVFSKYAMLLAMIMLAFALAFSVWRLIIGPSIEDRILALDTIYINAIAIIILLGIAFATSVFVEVAVVMALLGFVGTVVLAKFITRGDIAK